MASIRRRDIVPIELNSGNIHRSWLNHSIGSADNKANAFGVDVFRDGQAVDLTGVTVQGFFRDPMGNNIAITSGNTVSDNRAYVVLPQACYNYEGQFTLAIKLIGGGVTGTMRIVDGMVSNTNTDSAVAPTSAVPTYQEILAVYDDMVEATAEANSIIAPVFNASSAYTAGQYVRHDGDLYRLTADHAADVTWGNTSKTQVILGQEVSDLKSALSIQEKYIYTNLVEISDILTNKIVKNQAMQSAGVAEYETANNVCSTPVLTLCPGEYYIRMPWTSSAIVATWNKDTGDRNGYPVGIMAITINSAGVTKRTTGYGVDVFEYKLTLNYNAYVVASGHMQNDQYKFLFTISRASLNGTDDYYLEGENALLNNAVVRQLDWLKRDDCRDYLIADKQKKAPSTVVADASYNLPLVSARLNVTVGPIYFHDDVEIEGDNTIEYQVYFLFLNNNHAQTSYTKLYSGNFTTGKHIIGVNKAYADQIKYYIVLKYANGSVPVNVEEMCAHLKVTPVYGKNPLGVLHVRNWDDTNGYEPAGVGSTVESRLWFRTKIPSNSMIAFKNYDAVFSSHHENGINLSNFDEATIMEEGEVTFLVRHRNTATSTLMQEFTSFEALYSYLGFMVKPVNFKELQGARVMERIPVDAEVEAGNAIKQEIEDALVIEGDGIDFVHVPSLNIKDGIAYIAFQASSTHSETDNTTSIYLAEIDIANNRVDHIYKIAGLGTYGGVTYDAQCTSPMSIIVGDYVHIVFYGKSSSDGFAFHATFDITEKTFTTVKCNIVVNGTPYQLNSNNFFEHVGAANGIKRLGYEIIFSNFQTTDNETWYSAITSGNYKNSITPILSTTDFTNWQVYTVLPVECACDGELTFVFNGNYIIGASRHLYHDQTLRLWRYHKTNHIIADSTQISDCATRPTFYVDNSDNIMLVHGLQERYAAEWVEVNTSKIAMSKLKALIYNYPVGFTSFAKYNGDLYMAVQGYPNYEGPKICFLKMPE